MHINITDKKPVGLQPKPCAYFCLRCATNNNDKGDRHLKELLCRMF